MQIVSSYKVRIAESNQKIARAFIDTHNLYRAAVDFFIALVLKRWDSVFVKEMPEQKQIKAMEQLCIRTKNRPDTPYDFSEKFYKFPSYLRRAAISHAYGAVSSYMTRLETWTENRHGNAPGLPRAGKICPPLYRKNMFVRDKSNGLYSARIKVFIRNTWDWMEVRLRKSDVDYLERYCCHRTEHVPTLCRQSRKVWSLAFPFTEEVELKPKKTIYQQISSLEQKPLSQEELNTAKKILAMAFSKISESSQMLNMLLGNALLDNDIDYAENYLDILNSITVEDVSKFAKKYLNLNRVSLTVVHPQSQTDEQILENYKKVNEKKVTSPLPVGGKSMRLGFKGRLDDKMLDMTQITQYRLGNNTELILNSNKSDIAAGELTLQTTVPADVKPSVPAILAVLLNEGSKTKNYEQFYKDVHKSGITLKFDADFRSMKASFEALAPDSAYTLELIKEVFNTPRFTENALTYAKKLVKEAVMNLDESASDAALKQIFPNLNEYATKEEILQSIDTVTLADIIGFFGYIKTNAMSKAVITAPFKQNPDLEKSVITKLSTGFGVFKPFNTDAFQSFEPIKESKIITKAQPRNQADIIQYFKFKTNYNPKDQAVFALLNTILGAGASSRLFNDLRETQKLAYRVESNIDFVGNTGIIALGIKTTTDNPSENIKQYDNVKKSLDGFKKHVELLKTQPVSQEELEAAKLRLKTLILNTLETSDSQTVVLNAAKDTLQGINAINNNLKLIDEISSQDIQNAANYIFNSNSITSVLASQNTLDNINLH